MSSNVKRLCAVGGKIEVFTCSKHNYSGIDTPCPDCANGVKPVLCDGWRDVNKENPSHGAFIIMWIEGGNGSPLGGYIYDGCFIDGIYFGCDGEKKTPIAWMSRPNPPTFA